MQLQYNDRNSAVYGLKYFAQFITMMMMKYNVDVFKFLLFYQYFKFRIWLCFDRQLLQPSCSRRGEGRS